jgi:hypothetical protein
MIAMVVARLRGGAIGAIILLLATNGVSAEVSRAEGPKTVVFTGVDLAPRDTVATWLGAIYAVNGLAHDSLYLRVLGAYAWYDYTSGAGLGPIDGRAALFDAQIGYQVVRSNIRAGLSIGVENQDFHLSPDDPGNRLRGSETGFKVMGDVGTLIARPWFFDVIGSYSTAFESYWVRGRVGYELWKIVIGPEVVFYGNSDFRAERVGGFFQFDVPVGHVFTRTSLSVGYEHTDDDNVFGGREGAYGTLNFAFAF